MWPLLCAVLTLFRVTRCDDIPEFGTRTHSFRETVTLRCPRNKLMWPTTLHWIRFIPGNFTEVLGSTHTFNYDVVNKTPRFTTKQGKGSFDLIIKESKLSDTGFYSCLKVKQLVMEPVYGVFLRIKGPDPDPSVDSPDRSEEVHSGDSVDLQCWVQTENAQCLQEHMVLWFRSGQDQSGPGLVYAHRTSSGQCDRSQEDHGPHKCFYSFSKTMSRSDTGTYRCAVAACGHVLFGNKTNVCVKSQVPFVADCVLQRGVIILLSVLLTISIIVITALVYSIKRKCGQCFSVGDNTNKSDPNVAELRGSQRGAEVTYAAPSFNKVKTKKSRSRTAKAEEHVVYSDVRRGN